MPITLDEDVLSGDPRIAGTRIGVLTIYNLVVDGDHSPADTADQLDITLAQVHEALAYYYNNPEEMRAVRERHREAEEYLTRNALKPPELAE